ncbi:MAG: ATP-binding protein [Oligoflexia bacterium]|nr:ATP-binding protein [Oligoflexia bacterium]
MLKRPQEQQMRSTPFLGREEELQQLSALWSLRSTRGAALVACTGRRRIGKSALIKHFTSISNADFILFQGLSPRKGQTNQDQINNVMADFRKQFKTPKISVDDWSDVFELISEKIPQGKKSVMLLDEISWMAAHDPDFPGKFKSAWDAHLKDHSHLIVVICGSVSSWIEENILNNTGFVGRFHLHLNVEEMPLHQAKIFWGKHEERISAEEKLRYICASGCVPRYLEEVDPTLPTEKNLQRLAFSPGGILFSDFEAIFHDIFSRRSAKYKEIIQTLINGPQSFQNICKEIKVTRNGVISKYLEDLVRAGFLRRDSNYDLQGKQSKLAQYRIKDNYLRFYLKYILPHKDKIEKRMFKTFSFDQLANWPAIAGLLFESTVLNNIDKVYRKLKLENADILCAGPHFQRNTSRSKGACQIDILIQTRFRHLYVCEIKFKKKIDKSIIAAMKKKLAVFTTPKHYSISPVLICGGEIDEEVIAEQYFAAIITANDLMSQ